MISGLLLPLFLGGEPSLRSASVHDDPPIQIWINNDRSFYPGESAKVQVRLAEDGYLLVFQVDPDGYLRVLFPLDPDKDNFARGGKKYEVQGRGGRETFETETKGRGTVYAAVSRVPFRFETFVVGDHWDYRTLAPSRLSSNPEQELNELVRRMAEGDFDYDILSYDVVERVYASDYSSSYYGSGGYYFGSGTSFSLVFGFGWPYRSYYYDPYYYAYYPFYNPFYSPYYYGPYRYAYAPYYYSPYYYQPYYYGSCCYGGYYPYRFSTPYRQRYYYDHHATYGQTYNPYRFRGADGFTSGYRNRRSIYDPVISPAGHRSITGPARRVIDAPSEQLPSRAAPRRLVDNPQRVQGRPVEARRAQPEDRGRERSAGEPRLIRREVEARRAGRQIEDRARGGERESRPGRQGQERPREERRAQPERSREAPRAVERAAPPRGSEGRPSNGGGGAGSRPSGDGGRRHR